MLYRYRYPSEDKTMTCGIDPERATILRAPLDGNRRDAKSREGSHISVNVLGRYPPTECVKLFVICIDLRLRLDVTPPPPFFFSINASYPPSKLGDVVPSTDSGGLVLLL